MEGFFAWAMPEWWYWELFELGNYVLSVGMVAVTTVVLSITAVVASSLRAVVRHAPSRLGNIRLSTAYLLSRLLFYTIWVIGGCVALSAMGLNLSSLALIGGALSIGIGFGLQSIVSNFVSGMILLFDRSLKINDYIELDDGTRGIVLDINMRYTRVQTNDHIEVLVPNSQFITGQVTNYTHLEEQRRLRVPFGVAYGSDKELVKKAALDAAANVQHTLTKFQGREPQVWLTGFGDSSLDFQLIVWVTRDSTRRQARVLADYNWEIETQLKKHGLEIPFPQRDLHIRSGMDQLPQVEKSESSEKSASAPGRTS